MTVPYVRHPIKPTKLGVMCLRARLSLKETQPQFAQRFMVTPVTIHNWESGKSERINAIHQKILDTLIETLRREGRYLPEPEMTVIFKEKLEKKGNALD